MRQPMYRNPNEIVDYCESMSMKKTQHSFYQTAILAGLAGMYIALGALGSIVGGANFFVAGNPWSKLLAASIFPIGLMFVLIAGAELFTGNCLIFVGYMRKQIRLSSLIKNLALVWFFNLLGALLVVFLAFSTHTLDQQGLSFLHAIAEHKIHAEFWQTFLKGIGCNILVAGAVWMSYAAKDIAGKIWAIWFPIMVFIALGFDHVVANMFYLPYAYLTQAGFSISSLLINWIFATLGNFVGGSLVIAGLYTWIYTEK